jgi:hypothetical protein
LSLAIFSRVHAETAGAAGTGGEKQVAIGDFRSGHAAGFKIAEILNQGAGGEVRRAALPVVSVFLAQVKRLLVRHRQQFAFVAAAMENGTDKLLVFPGQTSDQNRNPVPLLGRKRPFHGTLVMPHFYRARRYASHPDSYLTRIIHEAFTTVAYMGMSAANVIYAKHK